MTANREKGEVSVVINDKPLLLRFTWDSFARIQDALGFDNFLDVLKLRPTNAKEFPILLWGGLIHSKPNLTIEEVRGWHLPVMEVFPKVSQAFSLAIWGTENPPRPPEVFPQSPVGNPSGTGESSEK